MSETIKIIKNQPQNFQDCVKYATLKFFKYFRNDIKQLIFTYPLDKINPDGEPFWKFPKRAPTPIEKIDTSNKYHV